MGFLKTIKDLFTPAGKEKKKPAGKSSQASFDSRQTVVAGKSLVKLPAQADGKSKKGENRGSPKGTKGKNSPQTKPAERTVAVGKTAVTLPRAGEKAKRKDTSLQGAWKARKEQVEQIQLDRLAQRKQQAQQGPNTEGTSLVATVNRGIQRMNEKNRARAEAQEAQQRAQRQQKNQKEMLGSAAQTLEANLKALQTKYERAPETITEADAARYNAMLDRYRAVVGNYKRLTMEENTAAAMERAKKEAEDEIVRRALIQEDSQENNTPFDIDPARVLSGSAATAQAERILAERRKEQLPKTLAGIGLAGIAGAQDALGTAMGLGEQAVWALSPKAQQDAASVADHEKQERAWKEEQEQAGKKLERSFELTEDDALGQFLAELNYNFAQQGAAMVVGGEIGKAGGTVLKAAGNAAGAAGANMAGKLGSQAAQRAAAAAGLSGRALQGAARYLQKNAGLGTMATLAGSKNYQEAVEGGADNEQAMAYAVLTAAAETVTEKLFGGNPLMDNEAGWVNRALYKMLGDRKFLKALDSVPVDVFNEGFEEVIANYLYSGARAVTGQDAQLPTAQENLHSFALGAAMGGIGQAAKLGGTAMQQALQDRETGRAMQEMGAGKELLEVGMALPGSRAEQLARELSGRKSLLTARELGRQYQENVMAQQLLTVKEEKVLRSAQEMARQTGAQVVIDRSLRKDANGYYQNGVIHLSEDMEKAAITVFKHELTHHLQQTAPEEYQAFRAAAVELAGEQAVQQLQEQYARHGVQLTEEEALDEVAANFTEKLLTDSESIRQLIDTNPTLADRFFAALRELLQRLTGRVDPKLKQAEKLWTEAYQAARSNKNTAPEGGAGKYSFAGKKAGGADLEKLNRAIEMQKGGADTETIRRETGWFTGADGKWRFEVDDSRMEFRRDGDAVLMQEEGYQRLQELTDKWAKSVEGGQELSQEESAEMERLQDEYSDRVWEEKYLLRDFLRHDKLFQAYPQLNLVNVAFDNLPKGVKGSFRKADNTIVLNKDLFGKALDDTLIHEIQHAIQKIEGFSGGSSPDYWAALDAETGKVKSRLRQERVNAFRALTQDEQNKYTRYQELMRVQEELEDAKDGTPEAERYIRYERESDQLYLELWEKPWFKHLVDLDRKLQGDNGEEYLRLYRNTAGEIEARDAANRRTMTQEQRRETKPDTGNEDTVFTGAADEWGGRSYSITDIQGKNGDYGQGVLLDTNIFDGISPRSWGRVLGNYVYKKLAGAELTMYDDAGNAETVYLARENDRVKKDGAKNSHKVLDKLARYRGDNIRALATVHLPEALATSENETSTDEHSHQWMDEKGWIYRTAYLQDRAGNIYKATLNTANGRDRKILYDITNIRKIDTKKEATGGVVSSTDTGRDSHTSGSFENSLADNSIHVKGKFSLKEGEGGLKALRRERGDVRRQIDKLEWLEEHQGSLNDTDAAELKALREKEQHLTERINTENRAAKETRGPEAERIMEAARAEAAAAKPTEAKKTLRASLLDTFSIQAGRRKALGAKIDDVAKQILQKGYASASDEAELYRALYQAGVVVDTTASREYESIRKDLQSIKIYVDPDVKAELGDNWNDVRRQAWGNRILLTTQKGEGVGIDVEHAALADIYPGMFDSYATDRTEMLEQMLRAAEMGRPEHISLMESAMREGGEDAVTQQMMFFEKFLTDELNNFSKQAGFEVRIKQQEILRNKKLQADTADAFEKQSQRKAMQVAQNRTLKVFQQLRKMRKTESAETQKLIDELVGGFDTFAKSMRGDTEATYRNLRDIYEAQRENDPNFLPDKNLEAKFARLDQIRIGEMTREEAMELYRAGTQLIHDIRTANREIAEKNARELTDLYRNSAMEINRADGDLREYRKGAKGKANRQGVKRRFWNEEQLSPMNYIEKMGGWDRNGTFYSLAKQLERGELVKQQYIVDADKLLDAFTEKHEDWIAKADGKGKDAIWYNVKVPAIFVRGHGDERIEEMNTVEISMTPMMKVKLYLDSRNYDNLRHIRYGGITFPDRKLYEAGNTEAANAQGVTVRLTPKAVKSIVDDMTAEEKELAHIIGDLYFDGMAKERINKTSNLLVGYDKAMADHYSPIYTNRNFLSKNADPAIMDATIEGAGMMKNRVWSGTPVLAVSVLDAFEKHRDFSAKYVGLAIPVRNMNALLNYTEPGYNNSMREILSKKWGADSVKYLDDLLVNLQNKQTAETTILDDAINKVLNNYVTAIFGLNPGTVIKQAPGFYMAGARLGFDTMPKTSIFRSATRKYRDLISKYTVMLEWRARGNSTRELHELRNNPNWTQKNAATRFLFGGAIQWMDLHTCAAVWPWAENYVKKHYPELKPGSKADIDAGRDPYYKKVAEVWEDAIANSQPMYDDMHTAQILHNNRNMARGITMFHTAQLTQANAIRQAHGELKRAEKEFKRTGSAESRKAMKQGRMALANSVTALLAATLGFEAIGMLLNVFKRNKQMRDENGEYTAESVGAYLADAMASDLLGNIVGADLAYDVAKNVFGILGGDKWYGFETPGLDLIEDTIGDAAKARKAFLEFSGGISGIDDAGELMYYLKTSGGDLRKSIKDLSMDVAYIFGVPAKNAESYIMAVMGWVNPDAYAAYQDTFGGYGKRDITGLAGKPREQKAAIRKLLQNYAQGISAEAEQEVQRLFAAEGSSVLPAETPASVKIRTGEDSGEEVKLTAQQKVDYHKKYSEVTAKGWNALIRSKGYADLSEEDKAGAVAMLYQYAADQAKAAVDKRHQSNGWKANAEEAIQNGAGIGQIVIYKAATEDLTADKDEDGKTIPGSLDRKKFDWLKESGWNEAAQAAIYVMDSSDSTKEHLDALKKSGINAKTYYRYLSQTAGVEPDYTPEGKAVDGSKNKKLYQVLDAMDLTAEQKAALYVTEIDDMTEDKQYDAARDAGVGLWDYAQFKANTGAMVSDKDKDGKSISGSKKKKVLDYINSMDIGNDAKDVLYYAAGYKESTISDAPWHGGAVKVGKSSPPKSTGRGKGKIGSSNAAASSPAVQKFLSRGGYATAPLPKAGEPARSGTLPKAGEMDAVQKFLSRGGYR